MLKMNNLETYENLEHKILIKLFKTKDCLTKRFDANDLYIEYPDKILVGEFKSRHYSHTRFDWFIEKDKVIRLQNINPQAHIIYINYFLEDNYLLIWKITPELLNKSKLTTRKMNKHSTESFSRYGEKVWKEVYMLKNEDAQIKIKNPLCRN